MDMLATPLSFSLCCSHTHTHTHTHTLCRLDSWSSPVARGYVSVLKQGGANRPTRPTSPWQTWGNGRSRLLSHRDLSLLRPRGSHLPFHHQPNDRAPRPHHSTPLQSSTLLSLPAVLPRCLSEGCLLRDWCIRPHKGPPLPPCLLPMAPGSAFHFEVAQAGSAPAWALGLQPAPLFSLRERLLFQLNLL